MTPLRPTLVLMLLVGVLVLAAGCTAGSESRINQVSVNTTPWITIDPVENHVIGDKFIISGTTNLAPGDVLLVTLDRTDPAYLARMRASEVERSVMPAEITVMNGTPGNNTWQFSVNTEWLEQDRYMVNVIAVVQYASAFQFFNITDARPLPIETTGTSL